MIVFRRRLIFWLLKAYLRKWGRTMLVFFILGLVGFFALRYVVTILPSSFPFLSHRTTGLMGAYTINNLPQEVLDKVSRGLTYTSDDGTVKPDVALAWKIDEDGKRYTFFLKKNIYFSDGTHLTSKEINYNFTDAKVEKPSEYVIIFTLKDPYSPFPVTLSRPIFKKGFIGVGTYKVKNLKLNGDFVSSIDLVDVKNPSIILKYIFYPTEDALKIAFSLGEISQAIGIHDLSIGGSNFSKFKSLQAEKKLNQKQLVTLFYNTKDPILSDKKIREALSYSINDNFLQGKRNQGPFSPNSWANANISQYNQDIDHAKELLKGSSATQSGKLKFKVKTLSQYEPIAKTLKSDFNKINIDLEIEKVNSIPDNFQIFLGDFNLPKDPDQYLIWHSDQENNITNYKNLRIDKLLEDGRKTTDINERKKIYADFQKYLLDDAPASFLYLPYTYELKRI